MPYSKFHEVWKNKPDTSTPVDADALNHIEDGLVATAERLRAYSSDWVNGKERGLVGNGIVNDGLLIQTILNELPEGGTLYLPPGVYATKQTIFVPPGRRVVGGGSSRWYYTYPSKTVIRAQTPWKSGDNATIKIADETLTSFGAPADGVTLSGFTIDHSPLPWDGGASEASQTVHGIYCEGLVRSIRLDDIAVSAARGNAFRFSKGASTKPGTTGLLPRGIEATRLRSVNNCRKEHFYLAGTTDSIFTDCLAASGLGTGFYLYNLAETKMVSCRALFTGGWGFHIDGEQDLATMQMVSPSTDRNALGALYVTSTGKRPITITSPLWGRDSSDETNPAVYIKGTASKKTNPLIIDGQIMMVGVNDNGSGTLTPRIGMKIENASMLKVSGMVWGVDTAIVDAGGHSMSPILPEFRRTGTVEAPVDVRADNTQPLETLPRKDVTVGNISMGTTVLRLTALPEILSGRTVSNVRVSSGATAAAATPTLAQVGIYREETDGSLTLVGSIANDTTLFAAANTVYDRTLSAPITLDPAFRHFAGVLVVSSATVPTVAGAGVAVAGLLASGPRLSAQVNGKTVLPATVAVVDMTASGSLVYVQVW